VTYLSAAEWQWLGIHACVRLGKISSAYIFRAGRRRRASPAAGRRQTDRTICHRLVDGNRSGAAM